MSRRRVALAVTVAAVDAGALFIRRALLPLGARHLCASCWLNVPKPWRSTAEWKASGRCPSCWWELP